MIKIIQPKRRGQTDSFFYEGEIATGENKTHYFSLLATGDIQVDINNKPYRNNQVENAIEEHKLTDRKLRLLEKQNKLTWSNNNWFEVLYREKKEDIWESDVGKVVYGYDDAIQLLKDYIKKDMGE